MQKLPTHISEQIIEAALADDGFRHELCSAPNQAITSKFGPVIPDGLHVKVMSEDDNTSILVVPSQYKSSPSNPMNNILTRAASDDVFRQRLLKDPASVMSAEFGNGFSANDVGLVAVSEGPNENVLVLPPPDVPRELSEDELDAVSGGASLRLGSKRTRAGCTFGGVVKTRCCCQTNPCNIVNY